jgi:hypothetical protein
MPAAAHRLRAPPARPSPRRPCGGTAWFVVAVGLAACGGKVTVDGEEGGGAAPGDSRQQVCEAGGGEWEAESSVDCCGSEDHCDLQTCELCLEPGCLCPGTACWDNVELRCRAP